MSRYDQPNEDTEMWREVRKAQAEARTKRKEANLLILRASSLPFVFRNNNDVVLLRDSRFPAVDYFPSTNHWKTGNRNMMGSAVDLIDWLERKRKA